MQGIFRDAAYTLRASCLQALLPPFPKRAHVPSAASQLRENDIWCKAALSAFRQGRCVSFPGMTADGGSSVRQGGDIL